MTLRVGFEPTTFSLAGNMTIITPTAQWGQRLTEGNYAMTKGFKVHTRCHAPTK